MRHWFMVYFVGAVLLPATCARSTDAVDIFFHDWKSTYALGLHSYTNTIVWGTFNGSNTIAEFTSQSGTDSLPFPVANQSPLTNVFQIIGFNDRENTITFDLSSEYNSVSSGVLLLGNISNYSGSTISTWNFENAPIDAYRWTFLKEYDSNSPIISGCFSTSETLLTHAEYSTIFNIVDLLSDADLGQGYDVHLGGLLDVGRIELMFATSSLGTNVQLTDFMLFNAGTVTEPSAGILLVTTFVGILTFYCELCGSHRQKISCRCKACVSYA